MPSNKIYAPDPAANGPMTFGTPQSTGISAYGHQIVTFVNGVADVDLSTLNPAIVTYMRGAGYGIDAPAPTRSPRPFGNQPNGAPAPDSRTVTKPVLLDDFGNPLDSSKRIGTPLRDAALDPRPEDFPPMTNAGTADPHGPNVRAIEVGTKAFVDAVNLKRAGQ